ncbi:MAG TPA: ABC transporter permease subunit, partial [Chloroflexota bacterium]|nr:ABC transporter permease subunit [Chloroflexota bacterium]
VDEHIGLLNAALAALLHVDSIPLSVTNNVFGMAWVMGIVLVPAVFFLTAGPMRAIDPSLEEAARMSGAGTWRIFRRINTPLLMPSILGALIYTFITAVSIFEIPALLGAAGGKVPVLATDVFYAVRPVGPSTSYAYGAAGVYGLALAVPSLIALLFYLRLLDRAERFQVVTGKSYQTRDTDLGVLTWLGLGFVILYLLLALALPLLVLLWASVLPVLQMPSAEMLRRITSQNYHSLFITLGSAGIVANTVVLVIVVAILTTFFSFMISWVVVRTRLSQRKLVDMLSLAPHAIPGLAFAFALAMLGILATKWAAWLPFAGTMVVIVLADLVTRLPYATRMGNAALVQIHPALEESAQTSGAPNRRILWHILLPLIRPTIVYSLVWTGLLTFQEVSMALFLAGPNNRVLSVAVFQLWQAGNTGQAAAGTIVMAAILGIVTFLILKATKGVIASTK